jgi:hypothetical protein
MGPGASAVGSLLNTLLTIIRPVQFERATIQPAHEDVDRSRSLRVLATRSPNRAWSVWDFLLPTRQNSSNECHIYPVTGLPCFQTAKFICREARLGGGAPRDVGSAIVRRLARQNVRLQTSTNWCASVISSRARRGVCKVRAHPPNNHPTGFRISYFRHSGGD